MCVFALGGRQVIGVFRLSQIKMTFLEVFWQTGDFGPPGGILREIRQFSYSLVWGAYSQSHFPSVKAWRVKQAQDCATTSWVSAHELRRCAGLGSRAHAGGARLAPSETDLERDGFPRGQCFRVSGACSPRSFFNCCFQIPKALFLWSP